MCVKTLGADRSIFMCIESLFKEIPSHLQVDALETSIIYALPKKRLEQVALHNVNIQILYRKILEESLILSQVHADLVRFESASNRYKRMSKLMPQVILRAPLLYIASYLHAVRVETLSLVFNPFLSRSNKLRTNAVRMTVDQNLSN